MHPIALDESLLRQLAGKTAIITGASNGIGAQTAALFNFHGANVVIADLAFTEPVANKLISTFSSPDDAFFIPTDIINWAGIRDMFKEVVGMFGSVEIVVANAGIMETRQVLDLDELDENGELLESKEAFKVIDVNLKGTLNTLRLGLFTMKSNPPCFPDGSRGSIVLLASISGYFGGTGVAAYIASKHGIVGLLRASQSVAQSVGIRVNAVAPFFTPTQITAGFAEEWKAAGLEANTPKGVAASIAQMVLENNRNGHCALTAGSIVREMEKTRLEMVSPWLGSDTQELMTGAAELFSKMGGYPLPKLAGNHEQINIRADL